jgi:purine-binding chemotaxis protein CheW
LALVVVVGIGETARALLVDDLLGKYQVVTKGLGSVVGKVLGISGGTILSDGTVGLIIDPPGLVRSCEKRDALSSMAAGTEAYQVLRRAPFSASELGGKHLTFFLDREEYGIPISQVQEIVRMLAVTQVPRAPSHLRGVGNLRGRILPVIDLRVKLGMPALAPSDDTRIIIVCSRLGPIGLIVDRVSEVEDIAADNIDPAPYLGALASTAYVRGVGISGSRAQFLLDVACIIGTREPALLESLA